MDALVAKFARKLAHAGLAESPAHALVAGLDADLTWSEPGPDPRKAELQGVFDALSINSLVCLAPAEPYRSAIARLAGLARENGCDAIQPADCETRTFLHDLPVRRAFDAGEIARALTRRKGAIVLEEGPDFARVQIVAWGTVSPEQGFVTASSVCFACFVAFFGHYLEVLRQGTASPEDHAAFERCRRAWQARPRPGAGPELMAGPFTGEDEVVRAMAQAGRRTVQRGLVDSYFGNISCLLDGTLYISQSGSSLDELEGRIDPVPLDGSTTAGLTASSELTAHIDALRLSGRRAMLHGHPKFAVILSMDCPRRECPERGRCHLACPEQRQVCGAPVVPGEVGTGPHGLCHTLPPALAEAPGAIVHGHGVFATGAVDFREAFATLQAIEERCEAEYFRRVAHHRLAGE
jgi:ribulose-5-phosphate 4-epimerase/fuculose-1-phosphate aldolase